MKTPITLLCLVLWTTSPVQASKRKDRPGLTLEKYAQGTQVTSLLGTGTIVAYGKEFSAKEYCNPQTISNPDQAEVFSVVAHPEIVVVLCTGSTDGETNLVSVFVKERGAKRKELKPAPSSSRISDEQIKRAVEELYYSLNRSDPFHIVGIGS